MRVKEHKRENKLQWLRTAAGELNQLFLIKAERVWWLVQTYFDLCAIGVSLYPERLM
jgi:hypothetical protein